MMNVLNEMAAEWGRWTLHAGWQAALAAGLVFMFVILTRRITSSQLRYAVLLVVLVKFAAPPFLDLPTGLFSQPAVRTGVTSVAPAHVVESATFAAEEGAFAGGPAGDIVPDPIEGGSPVPESVSNHPAMTEARESRAGFGWSTLLMFLHLSGTVVCVALLIRRYRFVRRIVRAGDIQRDGFLQSELARISDRLGMRSVPELRFSDETDGPFAIGAFRPVIVMPRLIAKQLEPDQLTIVIAHELAHVRRRDLLIGWIETLVSIVWWFHPAMWWLKMSLRQTREDCCDDVLLANQLAKPERYCETLIDAATRQSTAFAEPLVLGFSHREHPAARRIRRLMDRSLFRADRLRWPAIGLTLLLALLVLPGMRPERQPVTKTTLEGWFGWRNLSFRIDASEETAVEECAKIAQTYFNTRDGKRDFDQLETREKLEAILDKHPEFFYAQHLLGTWHRANGDPKVSTRLLSASLANAPVVLTQSYNHGNGKPLKGVEVPRLEIECNRVQNHSLDPSLNLKFVGLTTDSDGTVHLPVYDTVYRVSSQTNPRGYRVEVVRLGWFESKSHIGVLPEVMAWRPWSKPRDFTRAAADAPQLSDAAGTDARELKSGANTYRLGAVARGQADGTFTIEDGKGKSLRSIGIDLPVITNAEFMDHAVINLSGPAASRFEITQAKILDSLTKIELQSFQQGAGFKRTGKRQFHLFSLWDSLPDSVDLVLKVHNYDDDGFRYKVSPKVGATVRHGRVSLAVTQLIAGNHNGWSSRDGFHGEPQDVGSTSTVMFDIKGNEEAKLSLWVVLKDGRRWDLKTGGWHSVPVGSTPIPMMVSLDEIEYFELLPYVEPVTIYFENIQLPDRRGALEKQLPVIEFPVGGLARKYTSDLLSPMLVHFESLRGNLYSGISSNSAGFQLIERPQDSQSLETNTTVKWRSDAEVDFDYQLELVVLPGTGKPGRRSSQHTSGTWGAVGVETQDIPLKAVQAIRLQIQPSPAAK